MPQTSLIALASLLIYTVLSVLGLTLLKQSMSVTSPQFVAGGIAYGVGFLIWIFVILRLLPLSVGFPLAAGALILGTQVAGYFSLKESLTVPHVIGIIFILIGIGLVSWGATRAW